MRPTGSGLLGRGFLVFGLWIRRPGFFEIGVRVGMGRGIVQMGRFPVVPVARVRILRDAEVVFMGSISAHGLLIFI